MDVRVGGRDVDTTCAIVGGIVAARVGMAGIPAAWRAASEALPEWVREGEPGEDLSRAGLGRQCYAAAPPRAGSGAELVWTPGQWQRVRHGVRALSMDEKWDAYLEGEPADAASQLDRSCHLPGDCGREPGRPATGGRAGRVGPGAVPPRRRRDSESAFLELFLRAW